MFDASEAWYTITTRDVLLTDSQEVLLCQAALSLLFLVEGNLFVVFMIFRLGLINLVQQHWLCITCFAHELTGTT